MLLEVDFRILSELREKDVSISTIAEETGYDESHISRRIAHLENIDLVDKSRIEGRLQYFSRQTCAANIAFDEAEEKLRHIDLPEILSPSVLSVIWGLNNETKVTEITPHLSISRVRVYQILKSLRQRQIVGKTNSEYRLRRDYQPIQDFSRELARHVQQARIQNSLPSSRVIWAGPNEALAVPGEETDETTIHELLSGESPLPDSQQGEQSTQNTWHLTGLAAFQEYGLKFLQTGQPLIYYAAPDIDVSLRPEHYIIHALTRHSDDRRTNYCSLLMVQAAADNNFDVDMFMRLANVYRVSDIARHLLNYVGAKGGYEPPDEFHSQIPSWSRIEDNAQKYSVNLEKGIYILARDLGMPVDKWDGYRPNHD